MAAISPRLPLALCLVFVLGNACSAERVQSEPGAVAQSIPSLTPKFQAQLQSATQSPDQDAAVAAWNDLAKMNEPAGLRALLAVFEQAESLDEPEVMSAALNALAHAAQLKDGGQTLAEYVTTRRAEAPAGAKQRLILLLKTLDTAASRNLQIPFLSDSDNEVKCAAMSALEFSESPEVLHLLTAFLDSRDARVRKDAALALGRCKYLEALPKLIELLESKDAGVKANAAWALKAITQRNFNTASEAAWWLKAESKGSEDNLALLKNQFHGGNSALTPLALEDLGKFNLQREKLIDELSAQIANPDSRIRASICEALGRTVRSPSVLRMLVARLHDSSAVVAATAWRALKQLTGKEFPREFETWNQWLQAHD